ncbi:MAG: hypothetical protein HY905_05500 [Deltaproteobacteria bacterium]|nr:hypothetical protein [Deltaproteobacteria bacterium]
MAEFDGCFRREPDFVCYDGWEGTAEANCDAGDDSELWGLNGSAGPGVEPPAVRLPSDPFVSPSATYGRWLTDVDGDYLVDDAELKLAEAFAPYVVQADASDLPQPEFTPVPCDLGAYPCWCNCALESPDGTCSVHGACWRLIRPRSSTDPEVGEPTILFQVRPLADLDKVGDLLNLPDLYADRLTPIERRITLQYVLLWDQDFGQPGYESTTSHMGDDQPVTVVVEMDPDDASLWRVAAVSDDVDWPWAGIAWPKGKMWFYHPDVDPDGNARGVHPVLFLSDGKHHYQRDLDHEDNWYDVLACPSSATSLVPDDAYAAWDALGYLDRWHETMRFLPPVVANAARDATYARFWYTSEGRKYDWERYTLGNNVGEPEHPGGFPFVDDLSFLCVWIDDPTASGGDPYGLTFDICFDDEFAWDSRPFVGGHGEHEGTTPVQDYWYDHDISDLDDDGRLNDADSCYLQGALEDYGDTWDGDGDGVIDACDNCPETINPDQLNSDGDLAGGDACDACPWTSSGAGAGGYDLDGDEVPDSCDLCPRSSCAERGTDCYLEYAKPAWLPQLPDDDGDTVPDICDNCRAADIPFLARYRDLLDPANAGQANTDWRWEVEHGMPELGDACDPEPTTGSRPWPGAGVHWNSRREGAAGVAEGAVYPADFTMVPRPVVGLGREATCDELDPDGDTVVNDRDWYVPLEFKVRGWNQGELGIEARTESLPVMVSQCPCWDYETDTPLDDVHRCNELDRACPPDGVWGARRPAERLRWLPATIDRWDGSLRNLGIAFRWASDHGEAMDFDFSPTARTESVRWFPAAEALPPGIGVDPRFAIWVRPEVTHLEAAPGAWSERLLSDWGRPSFRWPYVARASSECRPDGPMDCDEYDNAYSSRPLRGRKLDCSAVPVDPPWWADEVASTDTNYFPSGDCPFCMRLEDVIGPYLDPDKWGCPMTSTNPFVPIVKPIKATDAVSNDLKFVGYSASALTQGILVELVGLDKTTQPLLGVGRMAKGQTPIDVDRFAFAADFAGAAGKGGGTVAGEFYLFGGITNDGTIDDRLWLGTAGAPGSIGGGGFIGTSSDAGEPGPPLGDRMFPIVWSEAPARSWRPAGTVGSVLVPSGDGGVYLIGGQTAAGVSNVAYRYSIADQEWSLVPLLGEAPAFGSAAGVATVPGGTWLYGGWDGAPSAGLYRFDPEIPLLERVDGAEDYSPGPRANAAITVALDGTEIVLFGGFDGTNWRNDLWSFDTAERRWTLEAEDCLVGSCPPAGPAAVVTEFSTGRTAVVPAQPSDPRGQSFWVRSGNRWWAASDFGSARGPTDCNGDGLPEDGVGAICRTATDWWTGVGEIQCDSVTGAPVCVAPGPGEAPSISRIPHLRDGRFVLTQDQMLYAVHERQLAVYDLADPARPHPGVAGRLTDHGREVIALGGLLLVATEGGIDAFRPIDRRRVERLWTWTAASGVDDVVAAGTTVIAVGPYAFDVLRVSGASPPVVIGSHFLVRVWPGAWLLDPPVPVPDLVGGLASGRRHALFDGVQLVIADRADIIAFDLHAGAVTREYPSAVLDTAVAGMWKDGTRIYATDDDGLSGEVLELSDAGFTAIGTHVLDSFVDNVARQGDLTVRRTGHGIEVAYHE